MDGANSAPSVVSVTSFLTARLDLEAGAWRLRAEGDGVWSPEVSVVIAGSAPREVLMPLFRAGSLRGHLADLPHGENPGRLLLRGQWATPGRAGKYPGGFASECLIDSQKAFSCS
ncbi:MAG: hypothetical protein K8E66_02545, partial [Phycisphaerales bacterium]|nr:hypothetical protein [Phycisphaerales bacterium]